MFSNKALRALILPLIVEQALAVTIGAADTVMVSSVGEAAVSGISLVDTINILLINIFTALATGGAVVSSQFLGKQDLERARRAAKQLIVAITALALIITVISLAFRPHILRLVFGQIEDDVMENAKTYFLLTALSYPFLALYNGGAALFRSMGNSKISMLTSLVMNIVNICGNAILIFIFNMGVAGAGTATLASRIIGAAIMMFLISRPSPSIYIDSFLHLGFDPGMIKNILRIGVPNGLESGVFQIGKVLVQSLVATFGTSAIAANAVANNIASMEVIPGVELSALYHDKEIHILGLFVDIHHPVVERELGHMRQVREERNEKIIRNLTEAGMPVTKKELQHGNPETVMNSWMNSPGHRANIMNGDFDTIGVGCAEINGRLYWVQLFLG